MMDPERLISWLAVIALSTALTAASKQTPEKDPSEEPFRSFRVLDAKLTLLTNQQNALKAALNPVESGSESTADPSGDRTKACRSMNFTAAGIARISGGLERLYKKRHQSFGIQMFRTMRVNAQGVRRDVNALAKAQTRSALDLATKRLDERIVSLVVQFQAASGGYGAVRCAPGSWTCCEPKRSQDSRQNEQLACAWVCIPRSERCTGFVGPRIRAAQN
jgi:hypothetical protein